MILTPTTEFVAVVTFRTEAGTGKRYVYSMAAGNARDVAMMHREAFSKLGLTTVVRPGLRTLQDAVDCAQEMFWRDAAKYGRWDVQDPWAIGREIVDRIVGPQLPGLH